jgi:outer membrane lipoprotein-sorting protein
MILFVANVLCLAHTLTMASSSTTAATTTAAVATDIKDYDALIAECRHGRYMSRGSGLPVKYQRAFDYLVSRKDDVIMNALEPPAKAEVKDGELVLDFDVDESVAGRVHNAVIHWIQHWYAVLFYFLLICTCTDHYFNRSSIL